MSVTTSNRKGEKQQGKMNDFDKGGIVGWHDEGVGKREIGRRLGRNEATVRTLLSMSGAILRRFYTKSFLILLPFLVGQQLLKKE